MSLPNDIYGRAVNVVSASGTSVYTVTNIDDSMAFNISLPDSVVVQNVYDTINSMAPSNYIAPAVATANVVLSANNGYAQVTL